MKWEIKVRKVNNGFVVQYNDGDGTKEEVFKEKDCNDETNRDHVIEMLYTIADFFGEMGSKHDKRRIKICYEKGNECEKEIAKKGVAFEVI